MSIIPLSRGNFANNRVRLHPGRRYTSGSWGTSGSLKVVVNRSHTQKDNVDMREGLDGTDKPQKFTENTFEGRRKMIYEGKPTPVGSGEIYFDRALGESDGRGYNYELQLALLLDGANPYGISATNPWPPELHKREYVQLNLNFAAKGYSDLPMHPRNNAELHIRRLKPGIDNFSSGSRAIQVAERILYPYYSIENPYLGSRYTNYNCANFFDNGQTPAVLYSAKDYKYTFHEDEAFTFEFYVKPRKCLNPGTLFHLPGNYSVSLVTGSEVSHLGDPLRYRLALQLGADANTNINFAHLFSTGSNEDYLGTGGDVKAFLSNAVLKPDHWHHCVIRWREPISGEKNSGDFIIDLNDAGNFSYSKTSMNNTNKALVFGAYYTDSTVSNMQRFFNNIDNQGVGGLYSNSTHPANTFSNIPNADLHEVRMWDHVRSRLQIYSGSLTGYTGSTAELSGSGMKLYIPMLYDPNAPSNNAVLITGDLALTSSTLASIKPQISSSEEYYNNTPEFYNQSFKTPINTNQAFCGGFLNVNVQSYMKEWINSSYPYMHLMSESLESWTSTHETTSSFFKYMGHQKRNSFILPCDNGNFHPDYNLLTYDGNEKYYKDSAKMINLKDFSDSNSFYDSRLMFVDEAYKTADHFPIPVRGTTATQEFDGRYHEGDLSSFTEPLEVVPGKKRWRLEFNMPTTKILNPSSSPGFDNVDLISNMVSVITIPQLYYGDKIEPGTVTIKSNLVSSGTMTGSNVILKDDGYGNLYRAQTSGSVAKWNSVGDIYYNEGLIFIQSPNLYHVGEFDIDIEFKGRNYANVMEINVPCPRGLINSSSNPNYVKLKPSNSSNEKEEEFVYISTVYLHDENLNVVGKAKLAQPIIKRPNSKYLFRLRVDF